MVYNTRIDLGKHPIWRWIASLILVGGCLALAWYVYPIRFETNDDSAVMAFVAGFNTGSPTVSAFFCGFLWEKLTASLYLLNDTIPWYTIVYMLLQWLSFASLFESMVKLAIKKRLPLYVPVFFFAGLFLGIYIYYCCIMQLTVMSAICGVGALAQLLSMDKADGKAERIISYILCSVLILFACSIRPLIGYVVISILLCTAIMLFIMKDVERKRLCLQVVLCALSALLAFGSTTIYRNGEKWQSFWVYQKERASYMDYTHITYEEDPELYKSIGWTEDLTELVNDWYFMDEGINTQSFRTLNQARDAEKSSQPFVSRVIETGRLLLYRMLTNTILLWNMLVLLLLCAVAFVLSIKQRKWALVILSAGYVFGTFLLLFFVLFQYGGRLNLRVISSILYLVISCATLLLFYSLKPFGRMAKKHRIILFASALFCLCFIFFVVGREGMFPQLERNASAEEVQTGKRTRAEMDEYVIANPEQIYVFDASLAWSRDAFAVYSDAKPTNLLFWGGSFMYSPLYYEQLESLGYNELYPEDFFEENVMFMNISSINTNLSNYMRNRFPGSSCEIIDRQDGFVVYRFVR